MADDDLGDNTKGNEHDDDLGDNTKGNEDDDDYKVGYGKPPKHTRFEKGKSGNPKGSAKKKSSFDELLSAGLEEKISMKVGDQTKRVSKREALVTSIINGALRHDPRCVKFVFEFMRKGHVPEPFGTSPHELEDLRRALKSFSSKPENPELKKDKAKEDDNDDGIDGEPT